MGVGAGLGILLVFPLALEWCMCLGGEHLPRLVRQRDNLAGMVWQGEQFMLGSREFSASFLPILEQSPSFCWYPDP